MPTTTFSKSAIAAGFTLSVGAAHGASPPATLEEMWKIIQKQQQEIEALRGQLEQTREQVQRTEEKVEVTGEALESREAGVSKAASWAERTRIGGYGELHYNNWDNQRPGGQDRDEIDFHRFVLYFGHEFTDRIRLFSEVEFEHSLTGGDAPGEVELEQAFIDFDVADHHTARGGLFLIPVGILNETHEPPTFYGVERNPVETNIIPTTWWEGGGGMWGEIAPGWRYDLYVHSGLKVEAPDFRVRGGRQKVAEAIAKDPAVTGRVKWTGMPGVELAATVQYQSNIGQGETPNVGEAYLFSTHAEVQRGPFGLRALYAHWNLAGSAPKTVGASKQAGWYIEPSYKIIPQLGIFARYNEWDNQAGQSGNEFSQVDVGFNYWPHPDVVLKFDYQNQDSPADRDEFDGFNLGIGFQF